MLAERDQTLPRRIRRIILPALSPNTLAVNCPPQPPGTAALQTYRHQQSLKAWVRIHTQEQLLASVLPLPEVTHRGHPRTPALALGSCALPGYQGWPAMGTLSPGCPVLPQGLLWAHQTGSAAPSVPAHGHPHSGWRGRETTSTLKQKRQEMPPPGRDAAGGHEQTLHHGGLSPAALSNA